MSTDVLEELEQCVNKMQIWSKLSQRDREGLPMKLQEIFSIAEAVNLLEELQESRIRETTKAKLDPN